MQLRDLRERRTRDQLERHWHDPVHPSVGRSAAVSARPRWCRHMKRTKEEGVSQCDACVERRTGIAVDGLRARLRHNLVSVPLLIVLAGVLIQLSRRVGPLGLVGLVAGLGYITLKLVLSSFYRPSQLDAAADISRVAVIVPVYNEDPTLFEQCLGSVLAQTRPADEIYVVDDGSSSAACVRVARLLLGAQPSGVLHRLSRNQGKCHAQAWALRRANADVIVT